ncbi:ABC transporter ATP-binding protein [uncultured Methanobrevibacter sp.]|uniref:ABC transporter ATP-binding protein n=1 Tax=uncultured Methanobrevibacter sp. TaxID=253161 RepID=UPI0025D237FA|nr:ABC transporter ATP-binding protein [uncultured Methanobrevibacter sp.]
MDNEKTEVKKIKTQIIPAIHNTVSLQFYLRTEDGKPIANEEVVYNLLRETGEISNSYRQITNEEGKVHLTLNLKGDTIIQLLYEGSDKYEKAKVNTFRVRPSKEEKELKNGHPYQVRRREEAQKKKEEAKKEKEAAKLRKIEEFAEAQNQLQTVGDDNVAIELRNVSLSFKIGKDKIDNLKEYVIRTINRTKEKKTIFKATDNVSFKIYKGEKVGIIGFNGAGKSTLLKIISGVYTPDEGEVIVNGNIAPLLSLGAGFDKNYSGRENIFLNGAILGYNEKFLNEKYDEILEFSELGEFINLPVKNYSSGMLSKLGFSIATIVDPDILILDEVLGVGDITFREKSREKLQSLMASNTTVLLVSHSIREIRNICDKAIWIEKGRVRAVGEVDAICDEYEDEAQNVSKEKTKKLKPQRF